LNYFVTGATGFIGRHLVEELLKREGTIHVLVREGSRGKVDALVDRLAAGDGRIVPVPGDLSKPGLGVEALQGDPSGPTPRPDLAREVKDTRAARGGSPRWRACSSPPT